MRLAALVGILLATALGVTVVVFGRLYDGRILPGVHVGDVDVSGRTRDAAASAIADQYDRYLRTPLPIQYGGKEWTPTPRDLGARIDVEPTADAALGVGRDTAPGLGFVAQLRGQLAGLGGAITLDGPHLTVDRARIGAYVEKLAPEVEQKATSADIALRPDGVLVLPSRPGKRLNVDKSVDAIATALEGFSSARVALVVDDVAAPLAEGDLAEVRRLAEKITGAPLTLQATFDGTTHKWTLERDDINELIDLHGTRTNPPHYEIALDEAKIRALVERIAAEIERPARNARFQVTSSGLKVIRPPEDGRRLEVTASIDAIRAALAGDNRTVTLPWQPQRAQYADPAQTAFPDLIERAATVYGGTIPDRMFNVELAASRLTGVVVGPGEEFSFNDAVGEVSYRAGYKRGYGISQDGDDVVTIPSEGGGICQVATTLFHSVFWAGYPVVERNWHLYWIPRYGQRPKGLKGLDATIDQVYDKDHKLLYALDLRWRNNTEAPVLVQADTDGNRIQVSLWGTKPTWQVKVAEPKIEKVVKTETTPVYQQDTTLPAGGELMVEHAEDGFQATIVRTIVQDGKIADETRFVSTYKPSRNVYLRNGPLPTASTSKSKPAEDRPATPAPPPGGTPTFITPIPEITSTPAPPKSTPTPTKPASGAPRRSPTPKATPSR